jgi:hypothetical protein
MITLNQILDITCAVKDVDKDLLKSKTRKNESYQTARRQFCEIAASGRFGYFSKATIGHAINRSPSNVNYYLKNKAVNYRRYDEEAAEIIKILLR